MTNALALAPTHRLKSIWMQRAEIGHPRLRPQHHPYDDPLPDIRAAPRISNDTLLALRPTLAEALAQAKRALREQKGWPNPGINAITLGSRMSPQSAQYLPDFSARLGKLERDALIPAEAALENAYWAASALHLLHTVFPAEYERFAPVSPTKDWWELFNDFYKLVDGANWFPIHWELLDHLWNGWMEVDGNPLYLARYLEEIPIVVFGIGPQEISDFPVLVILHGLLVDRAGLGRTLAELGINGVDFNALDSPDELRQRLEVAGLSHLSPPLDYLPEMALVVSGKTGNPFLDTWFNFNELLTSEPFRWDADIPRLRKAWVQARPIADARETFLDWFRGDAHDHHWPATFTEIDKIYAVIKAIIN